MAKGNKKDSTETEVKRISKGSRATTTTSRTKGVAAQERTTAGTTMWIVGMLIVMFGLFALVAVGSYFCNWRGDYAAIYAPELDNPRFDGSVSNICGSIGARLAHCLIGCSFGVFGMLIPLVAIVLGLHIISKRLRYMNHTAISMLLIMVFGSLTLGLAFGKSWDMFQSGWGGEFGIVVADLLKKHIGPIGGWITAVVGWILTGVFINIRVIEIINGLGKGVADRSKHLAERAEEFVLRGKSAGDAEEDDAEETEAEEVAPEQTPSPAEETAEETLEPMPESDVPFEVAETPQMPAVDEEPQTEEELPQPIDEPQEPATDAPLEDKPTSNIKVIEVTEHADKEVSDRKADHRPFDPDHTRGYKHPSIDLLVDYVSNSVVTDDEIRENKELIEGALGNFGIAIREMRATIGPTVTLYEIVQEAGVKISRIQNLAPDIAQALKARGIRIIAPMPERGTVGIEVPNRSKEIVSMRSAVLSERFQSFKGELPVVIGRNIQNENVVFDLAKMPHLLVAGATGMGKSVGLHAILASLLYRKDPSQLKLVLIDPKMVEFSPYAKLEKHFLAKMASEDRAIVIDPKKAVYTLNSLCIEMEQRLVKCSNAGVRDIKGYNELVRKREVDDEQIMPYIVVVIDEFADLIMIAKEVEAPVMRLAQKARAVGIHLIVATQRPSVDVITGRIKANFPARVAFRVMQMTDSRTIIDQPGADKLIGRGDMLLSKDGELMRIQCALIDDDEVEAIVNSIAKQPSPDGIAYALPDYEEAGGGDSASSDFGSEESGAAIRYDKLFAEIARDAVSSGQISTSYIQRNFEVGFNRAGRIMTQLEKAGIVGPQIGAKPREIKFYDLQTLEAKLQDLGVS